MDDVIYYGSHFIYYASYLLFALIIFLSVRIILKWQTIKTSKKSILKYLIIFILIIFFIYARFIEPNTITVKSTSIKTGISAKIAVITDIHIGIFDNNTTLNRAVNQINQIKDIDFVLIPGDITSCPPDKLQNLLSPLKKLKIPTYAVFGNHDTGRPGSAIQQQLRSSLKANNVVLLENSSILLQKKNINILGLGDNWSNNDKVSIINRFSKNDNLVVLTHNPNTIMKYRNNIADLTVSGHTHGGQIKIPFVNNQSITERYQFNEGLFSTKNGQLYISAGIGTVGLPIRFLVPPRVDILNLQK